MWEERERKGLFLKYFPAELLKMLVALIGEISISRRSLYPEMPLVGGFGRPELCLYGIRELEISVVLVTLS